MLAESINRFRRKDFFYVSPSLTVEQSRPLRILEGVNQFVASARAVQIFFRPTKEFQQQFFLAILNFNVFHLGFLREKEHGNELFGKEGVY